MITIRTIEQKSGQNWMRAATHCVHGHPFDERNTYWNEEGWRACKTCNLARKAAKRAALR